MNDAIVYGGTRLVFIYVSCQVLFLTIIFLGVPAKYELFMGGALAFSCGHSRKYMELKFGKHTIGSRDAALISVAVSFILILFPLALIMIVPEYKAYELSIFVTVLVAFFLVHVVLTFIFFKYIPPMLWRGFHK